MTRDSQFEAFDLISRDESGAKQWLRQLDDEEIAIINLDLEAWVSLLREVLHEAAVRGGEWMTAEMLRRGT